MKKLLTFLIWPLIFIGLELKGQHLNVDWYKQLESSGNSIIISSAIDNSGNIYILGRYDGTYDLDPGPASILLTSQIKKFYLTKYDPEGEFLWAKDLGEAVLYGEMKIDSNGNINIMFYFDKPFDADLGIDSLILDPNNLWGRALAKYDENGDLLFAKMMYSLNQFIYLHEILIFFDLDIYGNYYLTGVFRDTIDADPGPAVHELISEGTTNIYLIKLDVQGNFLWAKTITASNLCQVFDMSIDLNNDLYITGNFSDTIDMDPGAGKNEFIASGKLKNYLARYDDNGDLLKARSFSGIVYSAEFITDYDNNLYIKGVFNDTLLFSTDTNQVMLINYGSTKYLSRWDMDLTIQWAKKTEQDLYTFDRSGILYVLGHGHNISLEKTDGSGNVFWHQYLTDATPFSYDVQVENIRYVGDKFYLIGDLRGYVTFYNDLNPLNVYSLGNRNIFFVKYSDRTLGMEEVTKNKIVVYPNPTKGFLHFNGNETAEITIYDITGKLISKKVINPNETVTLDGAAGLYFVEVEVESGVKEVFKIIKID